MTNILGEDIRSVIHEVGEPCEVYDHVTKTITSDFVDFKRFWGTRIPFENEFQVLVSFAYNTTSKPGDRIKLLSDGTFYLISNDVSEYFEGEVITKESFMYKCNSTFSSKRKGEPRRNDNYKLVSGYDYVVENEHCLFSGMLEWGHKLIDNDIYGRFQLKKRKFIVSSDLDVKINDIVEVIPWRSTDMETWMVELVEANRLEGIKICDLGEFTG